MGQRVTLGLVDWVGDTWWMLAPAGPVLVLASVCLLGLWPAVLPCRAHCIQSQTPHYCRDAAKLEAVQRRAGRAVWGGGGLALVLAAGEGSCRAGNLRYSKNYSKSQSEQRKHNESREHEQESPNRLKHKWTGETVGDIKSDFCSGKSFA